MSIVINKMGNILEYFRKNLKRNKNESGARVDELEKQVTSTLKN